MRGQARALLTLGAAGFLILMMMGQKESPEENNRTISVTGYASLGFSPDTATVVLAIESKGNTASEAQTDNRKRAANIREALEKSGVPRHQLTSTDYRISEDSNYNPQTKAYESAGYRVSHQIWLKTEALKELGNLIDLAVGAGANRIHSIHYGLSEKADEQARKKVLEASAMEAKKRAETLAKGLGVRVGETLRISENQPAALPVYDKGVMMRAAGGESSAPPTSISPGEVFLESSVQVVFNLHQ